MYKINGSVWIEGNDGAFIGSGRVMLLERIKKYGSITNAAKSMKMSYRQAWELIKSMNKQSKVPLVETITGGSNGGGTSVTSEGEKMIAIFRNIQQRFHKFNELESKRIKI